jgi:hypothetical protein
MYTRSPVQPPVGSHHDSASIGWTNKRRYSQAAQLRIGEFGANIAIQHALQIVHFQVRQHRRMYPIAPHRWRWRKTPMQRFVTMNRQDQLFKIGAAVGPSGRFPRMLNGREEQGNEYTDDRQHDDQFQ